MGKSESEYWEQNLWQDAELNPGFYDPFSIHTVTYTSHAGWYYGKVLVPHEYCDDAIIMHVCVAGPRASTGAVP